MMDLWHIEKSKKLDKQIKNLPKMVQPIIYALLADLEEEGPKQPNWPNYSALSKKKKGIPNDAHHCHLKKGHPTYVACWCVIDKKKKLIEVFYVGTHENAPY